MGKWRAGIVKAAEVLSKDDDLVTASEHGAIFRAGVALGAVGGLVEAFAGAGTPAGLFTIAGILLMSSKRPSRIVAGFAATMSGIGMIAAVNAAGVVAYAGLGELSELGRAAAGAAVGGAFALLTSALVSRSGEKIRKQKEAEEKASAGVAKEARAFKP